MSHAEYWQVFCLGVFLGAILGILFCLATVEKV